MASLAAALISTASVSAGSSTWLASPSNGVWEAAGAEANWNSGVGTYPGDISGVTSSMDVATFLSSSATSIAIDATTSNASALNIGGITFGLAGTLPSSFTIGSMSGNTLSLTNGGTTQIVSGITGANIVERIDAPIVLQPLSTTAAGLYTFRNDSSTVSNTLILSGSISGGITSNTETLTLRGGNIGTNTVNGLISKGGATTLAVQKADGGTWILTNRANSYNGSTTVGGGILQAQDSFTYSSGNQTLTGGGAMGTGQLVINGATLQLRINGDDTTAAQALTYANSSFFANASQTSTIDMDHLMGASAQNKTLAFVASAVARGGKLTVSSPSGYNLQLNNLTITGAGDGSYTLNPTTGTIVLSGTLNNNTNSSTATFILDGTSQGNVVTANILDGVGTARVLGITKSGASTWTFSGSNTYSGNTVVSAGTLLVNGSHAAGVGAYSITGGTFGGTGRVTAASFTALAGSKLAPGGVGVASNALTLAMSGGMDISAASIAGAYLFDLAGTASSDKITLTTGTLNVGTLDFSDFTFTTMAGFGAGVYTLFDASSAITGTIGTATGTIGGLSGTLSIDGTNNDVILTVVPEPGAAGLLVTALFGLAGVAKLRGKKQG